MKSRDDERELRLPAARAAQANAGEDVIDTEGTELADPADVRHETHIPANGEYWRAKKDSKKHRLLAGTLLLIEDVRCIDGEIHSIQLAPHPLEKANDRYATHRTLIRRDFLAYFDFVPDGARIRAAEIAAVVRETEAVQSAIAAGPSADELRALAKGALDGSPAKADLLALPSGSVGQTPLTALARSGGRENIEKAARVQSALAAANVAWLKAKTATIQQGARSIAAFYDEQGTAALARIKDFQAYADGLKSGVKTLGLYLGDDVEVETIATGEGAPSSEKLTLIQRRAYMDEEFAVHLVLQAGADAAAGARWSDWDSFAKALATDAALRDRVLPYPRCVVAMRYRREAVKLNISAMEGAFASSGLVCAMEAFGAFMEEAGKDLRTFLLIRNGENVYRVYSEISTDSAPRLFPTDADKARPFKEGGSRFFGIPETEITPESVKYYEARNEYDALMLFYRRLLVLMWGLHDRLGLFGEFYEPGAYSSFMSLDLQVERCRYVYDDETAALGEGRPSFTAWWEQMNSYLGSGSRVLCYWDRLLTPGRAPACAKFWRSGSGTHVDVTHRPASTVSVEVARRSGEEIIVEPVVHPKYRGRRTPFKARVRLSNPLVVEEFYGEWVDSISSQYLVLDAVTLADIDYYVQSRVARVNYRAFAVLFLRAKAILVADQEQERPARLQLAAEVATALRERTTLEQADAIDSAIRLWRASHKGASVPLPVDESYGRALRDLRAIVHEALRGGRTHVERAARAAEGLCRSPLRLSLDGKGRTVLYLTSKESDAPFPGLPYPWAQRAILTIGPGDAAHLGTLSPAVLFADDARERVLHTWPSARDVEVERSAALPYDLRTVRALRRTMDAALKGWHETFGATTATEIAQFAAVARRAIRAASSRYITVPVLRIPLGLARRVERGGMVRDADTGVYTHRNIDVYGLIYASESITGALWRTGAEGEQAVRDFFGSFAKSPDHFEKAARTSRPSLEFVPLGGVEEAGFVSARAQAEGYVIGGGCEHVERVGPRDGAEIRAGAGRVGEMLVRAYVGLSKGRRSKAGDEPPEAEAVWTVPGLLDAITESDGGRSRSANSPS